MTQMEEIKRVVPGAELFFGESVAQYLADISDEAFYSGAEAEGLLLGKLYHDDLGVYCIVSGITQDLSDTAHAVGYFRSSSEGSLMDQAGLRRASALLGHGRIYAVVVDQAKGEMAMYRLENGTFWKVPSAMVENL